MSGAAPAVPAADRNLLFGILALQMDFVSCDALIAAMIARMRAKERPRSVVSRGRPPRPTGAMPRPG
jgi:hypothetical protein